MSSTLIEVQVDNTRNAGLFFQPLQRSIRGRFNLRDFPEPEAMKLTLVWPEPLPGQVIGLDLSTGTGYVREPLYDRDQSANRQRIAAAGRSLPPDREEFPADVPTWLFWLKRSVEAGHCKVVKGELPARIEGKPKKQFITPEHVDARDGAIRRLERRNDALTMILLANLPEAKRRDVESQLARLDDGE